MACPAPASWFASATFVAANRSETSIASSPRRFPTFQAQAIFAPMCRHWAPQTHLDCLTATSREVTNWCAVCRCGVVCRGFLVVDVPEKIFLGQGVSSGSRRLSFIELANQARWRPSMVRREKYVCPCCCERWCVLACESRPFDLGLADPKSGRLSRLTRRSSRVLRLLVLERNCPEPSFV